jgi:hypothetical protein
MRLATRARQMTDAAHAPQPSTAQRQIATTSRMKPTMAMAAWPTINPIGSATCFQC